MYRHNNSVIVALHARRHDVHTVERGGITTRSPVIIILHSREKHYRIRAIRSNSCRPSAAPAKRAEANRSDPSVYWRVLRLVVFTPRGSIRERSRTPTFEISRLDATGPVVPRFLYGRRRLIRYSCTAPTTGTAILLV